MWLSFLPCDFRSDKKVTAIIYTIEKSQFDISYLKPWSVHWLIDTNHMKNQYPTFSMDAVRGTGLTQQHNAGLLLTMLKPKCIVRTKHDRSVLVTISHASPIVTSHGAPEQQKLSPHNAYIYIYIYIHWLWWTLCDNIFSHYVMTDCPPVEFGYFLGCCV